MSRDYGVVEVIYLPTGEKRLIKLDRFDPEIHKQIGDVFTKEYAINYDKPIHLQRDSLGVAVMDGEIAKEEKEKIVEEQKVEPSMEVKEIPLETNDDINEGAFNATIDLSFEEIEKLKMYQIRQYAKHRGVEITPKTTKNDLVAQVRSLISS